jgi:hypothetical protein
VDEDGQLVMCSLPSGVVSAGAGQRPTVLLSRQQCPEGEAAAHVAVSTFQSYTYFLCRNALYALPLRQAGRPTPVSVLTFTPVVADVVTWTTLPSVQIRSDHGFLLAFGTFPGLPQGLVEIQLNGSDPADYRLVAATSDVTGHLDPGYVAFLSAYPSTARLWGIPAMHFSAMRPQRGQRLWIVYNATAYGPRPGAHSSPNRAVVVGASVGCALAAVVALGVCFALKHRREQRTADRASGDRQGYGSLQ